MAEQLMAMNGLSLRGESWWMARATISLPVPLWPVMTTLALDGATFSTRSITLRIAGEAPTIPTPAESIWPRRRRRTCISCSVRFFSSARWRMTLRRAGSSGFSTKSKTPSRTASTAASMVPLPVMITTGVSGCSSRSARTSASPSSLGITRSLMITSGWDSAAILSAPCPSAVWSTSYPQRCNSSANSSLVDSSSSTIRMRAFAIAGVWLPRVKEGEREPGAACWGSLDRGLARRLSGEPAYGVEVRKRLLPVAQTALGAQLQLHEGPAHLQLDGHAAAVAGELEARQVGVGHQVAEDRAVRLDELGRRASLRDLQGRPPRVV